MTKHAAAVLGIGMIAVGEDIGSEMAVRHFGNLVSLNSILYYYFIIKILFSFIFSFVSKEYYCCFCKYKSIHY